VTVLRLDAFLAFAACDYQTLDKLMGEISETPIHWKATRRKPR